jgi:hypothetical protein
MLAGTTFSTLPWFEDYVIVCHRSSGYIVGEARAEAGINQVLAIRLTFRRIHDINNRVRNKTSVCAQSDLSPLYSLSIPATQPMALRPGARSNAIWRRLFDFSAGMEWIYERRQLVALVPPSKRKLSGFGSNTFILKLADRYPFVTALTILATQCAERFEHVMHSNECICQTETFSTQLYCLASGSAFHYTAFPQTRLG